MKYSPLDEMINTRIGEFSVPTRLDAKLSLDPIIAILDRLGHPERNFPSVHVGGTSGKGSTSTFLARILGQAGYKVGLFTKPHLISVRERFVINDQMISPEDILTLLEQVKPLIQEKPTWFELLTALVFQYFSDQKVDIAVIEVGLGGTYDATNVLMPELSILTNVGLDHTEVLGDTVEKIAADKVGIIKPGRCAISGVEQPRVIQIVEERCSQVGAQLHLCGQAFNLTNWEPLPDGSRFDFNKSGAELKGIELAVLGLHQAKNATLAIAAANLLQRKGYTIPNESIRQALKETKIPGRMEIFDTKPAILLDGAHSQPKMSALSQALRTTFGGQKRLTGLLSFSKGHDAAQSLQSLLPLLSRVVVTEFDVETDYGNKRAQDAEDLARLIHGMAPEMEIKVHRDPYQALKIAEEDSSTEDMICVTGSMFLAGQIRSYLLNEK